VQYPAAPARALLSLALVAIAGCAALHPRFSPEIHAALADRDMRRLETGSLVLYYPADRRDQALRFADRAEGCVAELKARARVRNGFWREKVVIVLPELPLNNAFVSPAQSGSEEISVVPTFNTLDFATEFGLPPDPAHVACHEITHYVQHQQIAGVWGAVDRVFGDLFSPQFGFDSWFFEGLATHYEAALQPGAGRPRWPIFRGMFHAAYAGGDVGGGDLSAFGRMSPVGQNYLVGTFFIDFLAERYGDEKLWRVIEEQAASITIFTDLNGRFRAAYGKSLSALLDEFAAWTAARFPVRPTPTGQRRIHGVGADARYARGPRGDEAAVWNDVDLPTRLTVWGPDGRERATVPLVDLVPPRTLVYASPLLTSGLGITGDGTVYLTAIDFGATQQTTRLLRWNGELSEVATDLGAGAAVDPAGRTYYYLAADGDRWQLAAYDLATGARRIVTPTAAGQYVLGAQVAPDGKRLIASVWDKGFVLWIVDAASGARLSEIRTTDGTPVYDGAFVDDRTASYLAVVDGRFQVAIRDLATGATRIATDAPYAALHGRAAGGTIRFLNREGWRWTIDEVALPALPPPPPPPAPPPAPPVPVPPEDAPAPATTAAAIADAPAAPAAAPAPAPAPAPTAASRPAVVQSDRPYSQLDHLFVPQLHALTYTSAGGYTLAGLALGGGDRLGFHRWSVSAYWQPATDKFSGEIGYINSNLAPWTFWISAANYAWETDISQAMSKAVGYTAEGTQRGAVASFGRSWRESLDAAIGATVYEERESVTPGADPTPPAPDPTRRMAGASLDLSYRALESTRIGVFRGWVLGLGATHYPDRLSTRDADLTDTRAVLGLYAPLPWTRRHGLSLIARGRALVAPGSTNLLQVGGISPLIPLWTYSRSSLPTPSPRLGTGLPAGVAFQEALRGYENYEIYTDSAGIAELSWRYPLVIDRGSATTLWLFPASFVRELELELFAAGAVDDRGKDGLHAAAGGAVSAHFAFAFIPFVLSAQVARRLVDDRALTTLIGCGFGL